MSESTELCEDLPGAVLLAACPLVVLVAELQILVASVLRPSALVEAKSLGTLLFRSFHSAGSDRIELEKTKDKQRRMPQGCDCNI
jgi:hypothetical protein